MTKMTELEAKEALSIALFRLKVLGIQTSAYTTNEPLPSSILDALIERSGDLLAAAAMVKGHQESK